MSFYFRNHHYYLVNFYKNSFEDFLKGSNNEDQINLKNYLIKMFSLCSLLCFSMFLRRILKKDKSDFVDNSVDNSQNNKNKIQAKSNNNLSKPNKIYNDISSKLNSRNFKDRKISNKNTKRNRFLSIETTNNLDLNNSNKKVKRISKSMNKLDFQAIIDNNSYCNNDLDCYKITFRQTNKNQSNNNENLSYKKDNIHIRSNSNSLVENKRIVNNSRNSNLNNSRIIVNNHFQNKLDSSVNSFITDINGNDSFIKNENCDKSLSFFNSYYDNLNNELKLFENDEYFNNYVVNKDYYSLKKLMIVRINSLIDKLSHETKCYLQQSEIININKTLLKHERVNNSFNQNKFVDIIFKKIEEIENLNLNDEESFNKLNKKNLNLLITLDNSFTSCIDNRFQNHQKFSVKTRYLLNEKLLIIEKKDFITILFIIYLRVKPLLEYISNALKIKRLLIISNVLNNLKFNYQMNYEKQNSDMSNIDNLEIKKMLSKYFLYINLFLKIKEELFLSNLMDINMNIETCNNDQNILDNSFNYYLKDEFNSISINNTNADVNANADTNNKSKDNYNDIKYLYELLYEETNYLVISKDIFSSQIIKSRIMIERSLGKDLNNEKNVISGYLMSNEYFISENIFDENNLLIDKELLIQIVKQDVELIFKYFY